MTYRTKNNRDDNEAEIVRLFRRLDCLWIEQDRHAGFDGVMISPISGTHIVEIKNPAQRWKLTQNEKDAKAEIEARGIRYNIIETIEQAQALAGR